MEQTAQLVLLVPPEHLVPLVLQVLLVLKGLLELTVVMEQMEQQALPAPKARLVIPVQLDQQGLVLMQLRLPKAF
jgi:hypothetical protein